MLKLYNTLTRKKEVFRPLKDKRVGLYTCGPTVYMYAHIGNLRTYIFEDILRRVLEYNEYKVKHVMNITDVGHLTSDADTGRDKVEERARKERKSAKAIARFYTQAFKKDIKGLKIEEPHIWSKATDHIKEQIELVKILEKKRFAYVIKDGVYFDTSKFKGYGKLAGLKKQKLKAGARIKQVKGKKNIHDFALWKFSPKRVKRQQEWPSPWGRGFPGWHLECAAMSMKYLDLPFDIHCGGIDHIPIHHTNEIAEAEAATGKKFVNYWLHGAFLILKKDRMGKSEGNIITLQELIKHGFNPLVYRYFTFLAHYRSPLEFSWKALEASQNALNKLYEKVAEIKPSKSRKTLTVKAKVYQKRFLKLINNDLDMPKATALMWQVVKTSKISNGEKYGLLLDFDKVFGLKLAKVKKIKVPQKILDLVNLREKYRQEKKWQAADKIRKKIKKLGYQTEDTKQGPKIKKLK